MNMVLLFIMSTVLSFDTTDTLPTKNLISGFYLAVPDTTNNRGIKLEKRDEYYFLDSVPIITMMYIDTVYKYFNKYNNNFELIIKFNRAGAKKWHHFTIDNLQRKVGLVLNNKLINVATIVSIIPDGTSSLYLGYPEKEVNALEVDINSATRKAKDDYKKGYH